MNPHDHHIDQADRIAGGIQGAARLIGDMLTASADPALSDHDRDRLTGVFPVSCVALVIEAAAAELGRHIEWLAKENAACSTSASGAEDDSANGYRVGQPHERV